MKKLAAILLLVIMTQQPALASYGIFDLNVVADKPYSLAYAISDALRIVGKCSTSETDATQDIPFVWDGVNGIQALAGAPGVARCINAQGIAGGYRKTKSGQPAILWDTNTLAIYATLPSLGGPQSAVTCFNENTIPIGWSTRYSGTAIQKWATQWPMTNTDVSYIWSAEAVGPVAAGYQANAVSNLVYDVAANLAHRAVVGQASPENGTGFSIRDGIFQFDSGTLTAVNIQGVIVGYGPNGGAPAQAFVEEGGVRTYLTLFPGDIKSYVWKVNNAITATSCFASPLAIRDRNINSLDMQHDIQAVGYSVDASDNCHAFVWTKGSSMVYLPNFGVDGTKALGINDLGEICGQAKDPSGRWRAVLWVKVDNNPDPPRVAAMVPSDNLLGHVRLEGSVVISPNLGDGNRRFSYIQNPKYFSAIKVLGSWGMVKGDVVILEGNLTIEGNELTLRPSLLLFSGLKGDLPLPIAFTNRALKETAEGRAALYSGRVRVWGKVLADITSFDGHYLLIDDGSHVIEQEGYQEYDLDGNPVFNPDGTPKMVPPVIGIRIYLPKGVSVPIGEYHIFEGVKGNQNTFPSLWDVTIQ